MIEIKKKYFWLKLPKDFFSDPRIKKLRRIAGGDVYVIIFLKMMLIVINNDGIYVFEGIEKTLSAELALKLEEEEDNIKVVLSFLIAQGELHELSGEEFFFKRVPDLVGKEGESAARVRKYRDKLQALQCNDTVIESNDTVTQRKRKEKEKEKEKKVSSKNSIVRVDFRTFKNQILEACPNFAFNLGGKLGYLKYHKGFCLKNDHIYDLEVEKFISKDDSFKIWKYLFSIQDKVFELIANQLISQKNAS